MRDRAGRRSSGATKPRGRWPGNRPSGVGDWPGRGSAGPCCRPTSLSTWNDRPFNERPIMHLPRLQFSIGQIMIAVATVALIMAALPILRDLMLLDRGGFR